MTAARSLVLLLAASGCRGQVTPEDCQTMTEHYLALSMKEAPRAAPLSSAETAAVREVERGLKRAVPAYREVQDHCEAMTRTEVSCALEAESTRDWEGCVHPRDAR
jgi:hypothetical protein